MSQKKTLAKTSKAQKPEKNYSCRQYKGGTVTLKDGKVREYKTTCRSVGRPANQIGSNCSKLDRDVCTLRHFVAAIRKTLNMPDGANKTNGVMAWMEFLEKEETTEDILKTVQRK